MKKAAKMTEKTKAKSAKDEKAKKVAAKKEVLKESPESKSRKDQFFAQLKKEKFHKNIIEAFESVDQKIFFDSMFKSKYYGDEPISIGYGLKSDNFLNLARMIKYLDPKNDERILEIGTGSGYSTAILSTLCREVVTVELNEKLASSAKTRLYGNDFGNIRFFAGDGTVIEENVGRIDGIIIHAACRKRPIALIQMLKENGRIVLPMGPAHMQQIVRMECGIIPGEPTQMRTSFHEQGSFTHIEGPYGYSFPVMDLAPEEEEEEIEPPKKLETKEFLFEPPAQED